VGVPRAVSFPSPTSGSEGPLAVGEFDTSAGERKIDFELEPLPEDELDSDGKESNIVQ
jgi:hypothetical protein